MIVGPTRLTIGELANFAIAKSWNDLVPTKNDFLERRWRLLVATAEDEGLLMWSGETETWRLTAKGVAMVTRSRNAKTEDTLVNCPVCKEGRVTTRARGVVRNEACTRCGGTGAVSARNFRT